MDQANFREILKKSCLEVYDVPEGTTPDTLISCFQGFGLNAHLVTEDVPKWLILLQNPNVAEKFVKDTENSPLSIAGQALSVKPCSMPGDIPPEWEQFLQQPQGQALPGVQHIPHDRSSQSEPHLAYMYPQSNVTGNQGPFQPQHGMAYPHPNVPYSQGMEKHVHGPQPEGYFYQGSHIEPYAGRGRQSFPVRYQYPGQQQQYPGQYMSHPPNMPPPVTGYPYPGVGFQPIVYPNMPPPYQSERQEEDVKGYPGKQRKKQNTAESDSESEDSDNDDSTSHNKIIVTNLTTKITESKLKTFFKNRKKSGGGTIESIDYQTDRAIVAFQDPAVVDRILQKLPLLLEGKQIHVERYASEEEEEEEGEDDSSDNEIEEQKCLDTIEVTGMAEGTSCDTLEFYFESKKAAGVRLEVLNFDFNEEDRIARIQYASEEDMRKVLGREHKIDGVKLEVKEYIPPKPRPLYEDKILLKGVNPTSTKDGLTNFLEAKANAEPTNISYGEDDDIVIVSFAEPPDFEKLTKACKTKAIDGCYLQMQRVPISNCVKVSGIGETGKDTLEFYFENTRRSGGGEIEKIDHQPEDGVCFIYFKDHKVVDKVCCKQHTIDNNRLSVKMYNEMIEVSDGDSLKLKVPEPIIMKNINERKIQFLLVSKTAREMLKHSLSQKYTVITFPEEYTGNIQLECVLTKDVNECKKLAKTWKKDNIKALEMFIDKLNVENIDVLQDAWDQMNITDANDISASDEVLVLCEDVKHRIHVIGFSQQVHIKVKELRERLKEIQEDLDRKKKQVQESVDLKPHQLLILKKQRYMENMEGTYKGMKVSADKKNHRITFEGLTGEVITAKVTMYDLFNGLASSIISPFSDGLYQLLNDSKVKRYISEKMTNENISAVWAMDQGTMKVYAKDDENAVKAAHILKESLVETKVSVSEESQYLLSTDEWDDKVSDIQQNNVEHTAKILCDEVGGIVMVHTTDVDKGTVLEIIHTFLDENTILEKTLELKTGIKRFLEQSGKRKQIEDIASSLRNDHVKIEMNDSGIVIKGTALGLGKASQRLNAIIQKVIKKKHVINKPGITSLMESEIGLDKLEKVGRQTDVVILPDEFEDDADERCGQQSGKVVQEMVRCDQSQFRIMVMLGDITELNVDVLVNTANENLKHRGGLAKAIVEKGGEEIQVECDNFIKRKKKRLRKGELFCGKPGNLQCKMIAHAVCPSWQGGQKNEEEDLSDLVIECMEKSNERGYTSIAIPPLGAGTFNIPVKTSAKVIVQAVEEYFNDDPNCTVKDIFLCDVDRNNVEVLIKALRRHFGSDNVTTTSNTADDQQWSSARMSKRSYVSRSVRQDTTDFEMPTESDLDGNVRIELVKGEIAKQKADIIVNTAGQDLQLHNGAVSNSLLTAAGQGIQEECDKLYPNGISHDEIAVTEGHRLMCQNVCHGSLPQWDGGATALVVLQNFMTKCLQAASDRGLQTVAFPALGTGNLGYPREVVAKEMYRIVSQFAGNNPKSTLNKVLFVVFHKDNETIKAFEEAQKSRNVSQKMDSPKMKPKSIESPKKGRHSFASKDIERSDSVDADEVILDIGKLNLKICEGDLTTADVDAIVNTTNAEFDMQRGAVANAIRTKGGAELEKQIRSKKKVMKRKGITITSGGDLKCQFIVHINTEDQKHSWKTKIVNVLQEAEDSDTITSIAFPVLGTGLAGGPTVEEAAKNIFEALMEFQGATGPESLKEIHVVIFQSEMFQRFLSATEKCFKTYKGGKDRGIFRQITDYIIGNQKGDLEWNPQIRKVTLEPSSYPIVIFGDDNNNIEEAMKLLENILEDVYTTKTFKDEIIKEFRDIQKKAVKNLQDELHIEVVLEKRLGRIKLKGLQENVMEAADKIHDLIRKADKQKHSQQEEELIADMVTWCYIEVTNTGQTVEEYPPNVNRILEKAYRQQEKETSFTDNCGNIFLVDLDSFEEYIEDNPTDRVKVIRRNKMEDSGSDIPSQWSSMKDTENLTAVVLQPSDQEHQTVVAEFQKTIGTQKNVTQVQRIQNRTLYQQYTAKKKWMEKQNPKGTQNERSLWHGTAPDAIDSINAHGFNRSYCGKNATAFGNGVYFAVQSSYSAQDQYAHVDSSGKKRMYLCKVLTGEFTQGKGGLRVPPQKPNAPAHILYDSVVDTQANPKMYIIFNDTQAYPEYLLTFDK